MDDLSETLSAMQTMAQEYRQRHRLDAQTPMEAVVPHHVAQEAIRRHGSLQAAADTIFDPGTVKIIDQYWQRWCWEMTDRINRRFGHSTT